MQKLMIWLSLVFMSFGLALAYTNDEYPPITPENVAQLEEVEVLGQGNMNPDSFAWSPNSEGFAIGGSRGFWLYPNTNSQAQFFQLNRNIRYSLFSADETLVFLSDGAKLFAYDIPNETIRYEVEGMRPLAISHDGTMLAYEVDLGVRVLDIETGEMRYDLSYQGILEDEATTAVEGWNQENSFEFAQFLPDDSELVIHWRSVYEGGWEGRVDFGDDIWTLASQEIESVQQYNSVFPSYVNFFAFDASGTAFAIDDEEILTLDETFALEFANDGRVIMLDTVRISQFAEQGSRIAALYYYSENGETVHGTGVWDIRTGAIIAHFPIQGYMSISSDGTKLTIGLEIYDINTGENLAVLQGARYEFLRYVPDRTLYYGMDDTIQLLETSTLGEIASLPAPRVGNTPVIQTRHYLFQMQDNQQSAYSIDSATGEIIARYESTIPTFRYITFSPDTAYFVTSNGTEESRVLWNAYTGESIPLAEQFTLTQPYFHPETGGLILWNWQSSEIQFYDIAAQTIVASFPAETSNTEQVPPPPPERLVIGRNYFAVSRFRGWDLFDFANNRLVAEYSDSYLNGRFSPNENYFANSDEYSLEIIASDTGEIVQRIESDEQIWYSLFLNEETVELIYQEDIDSERQEVYSIETGEATERPTSNPIANIHEGGLQYFLNNPTIKIMDSQGNLLRSITTGTHVSQISLNADGTRLYLNYYDGTIGIWAVVND